MSPRILVWFWSGGGGGSQFAAHLAHRLTKQFGQNSVSVSLRADDPTIATAERLGVRVFAAQVVSDRKRAFDSLARLRSSARVLGEHARDADVVVIPMNFATAAPLSLTLRQPLVYCAHDPEPHPGDFEIAAQRLTQSLLMQRASTIVALSQYSADRLRSEQSVVRKLRIAPLSSVFEPRSAPALTGPTQLLFLGRMIAYKGLDVLAGALDRIARRDDWRLVIAGAGPAMTDDALARFSHKQIETVRREWLSEEEIDEFLSRCDLLLAPYRQASQSGVVAEALAWGKACVATPVGALPEQLGGGEAGWLARAATAEAFGEALMTALNDPAARLEKAQAAEALARAAWEGDYWGWLSEFARAEATF